MIDETEFNSVENITAIDQLQSSFTGKIFIADVGCSLRGRLRLLTHPTWEGETNLFIVELKIAEVLPNHMRKS